MRWIAVATAIAAFMGSASAYAQAAKQGEPAAQAGRQRVQQAISRVSAKPVPKAGSTGH
jgi:hypothetical protein